MLQFCRENGMLRSFAALQDETHVSLNAVESKEAVESDIREGRWDAVLELVGTLSLPTALLFDLYEHIVIEMVEAREVETARMLLRSADVLHQLRRDGEARYSLLERMVLADEFDPLAAYPLGASRDMRRAALASAVQAELSAVAPARLVSLLGQAVKWQQHLGILPPGTRIDLLRGIAATDIKYDELPPAAKCASIKFGKDSLPLCGAFSPDGLYFATGSSDGFIEVWDYVIGKLNKTLRYQADDHLMMHKGPVHALAFSLDSEMLATGAADGAVKVWAVRSGQCLRHFPSAHAACVLSLCFSRDATQLLSAAHDETVRVHGLTSGRMLKELRGHSSFVNAAFFAGDGASAVSGAADGLVHVWALRSAELAVAFAPSSLLAVAAGGDSAARHHPKAVRSVLPVPDQPDAVLVVLAGPAMALCSLGGKLLGVFECPKPGVEFTAAAFTPRGTWLLGVGDDSHLYAFATVDRTLRQVLPLSDKPVSAVCVHPSRNLVATFGPDKSLRFWEP